MESLEPFRGVQQGDPFLLYLLMACMEWLGHLIQNTIGQKRHNSISICREGPQTSNLMFAND